MKSRFVSIVLIIFLMFSQYAFYGCESSIDYTLNEDGVMQPSEREKLAKKLVSEYCDENGIDKKYKLYMSDIYYIGEELGYIYSFNTEGSYTGDTSDDISAIVMADGSDSYILNDTN